ncbi:hypothetical protein SLE2022_335750 [Rubroshorea leprosula]
MDVVLPVPAHSSNFDSSCSSPYITAPSSPQRFGNVFFSAPTSPTRASSFHRDFNDAADSSQSAVPFDWEEKPGTPKAGGSRSKNVNHDAIEEDFEFDFSGQLERTSLSAEELFDGGKIRPLKPPPGYDQGSGLCSPRSPRSPKSPKSKISPKKELDPFAVALEKTRIGEEFGQKQKNSQRGRHRSSVSSSSSYVHKGSRSLSPLRVPDIMFEPEHDNNQTEKSTANRTATTPKSYASSILSAISFSKSYRKWRLKDFLLFRSASEGRTGKDQLRKYALLAKKETEDVKNSSFRSTESVGSVSSRRRGPISAHELHYTANRAVTEEMKRKTFLPYKQGLLGCLGFNPGMHEISRGIGSMTRG